MRYLYSLILSLALPFLFVRLWWRSRHNNDYRKRWNERLGSFPHAIPSGGIWLHAVSLGEAIAATPLIKILLVDYPNIPIIVTSMTPTGSAYINSHFKDRVFHSYLPFDLSFLVKRFLRKAKPKLGIIMETELWPNLIHCARAQHILLIFANARLSAQSAKGYRRIKFLIEPVLNSFTQVLAQSQADGQRFLDLGLQQDKLVIVGNIKFDLEISPDLNIQAQSFRDQFKNRIVWVAASTHEGEEEILLKAFANLQNSYPDLLLVIVPRHADRFARVADLCKQAEFKFVRRSLDERVSSDTAIYLADSFGEMMLLYAAADFVFVGGSLVPHGGQNLLQPAALALAILTGPELHNFKQVSELLLEKNALKIVHEANQLSEAIRQFIVYPEQAQAMGLRALGVVDDNRGALKKQVAVISEVLKLKL